jgi:polyferredoxin
VFVFLVVMALFHFRFWCRYLCPLGALLGTFAKAGRIRLRLNSERCNDCKLCVAFCPGACDPHLAGRWKKEECYLCFTCREQCPSGAISFEVDFGGEPKELIAALPSDRETKHKSKANDG